MQIINTQNIIDYLLHVKSNSKNLLIFYYDFLKIIFNYYLNKIFNFNNITYYNILLYNNIIILWIYTYPNDFRLKTNIYFN